MKKRGAPELELGEAADEGAELIRWFDGKPRARAIKKRLGLGVDLGGKEADEEVEDEDGEGVGDDVEALEDKYANEVYEGEDGSASPPATNKWCGFVEVVLVAAANGGPGWEQAGSDAGSGWSSDFGHGFRWRSRRSLRWLCGDLGNHYCLKSLSFSGIWFLPFWGQMLIKIGFIYLLIYFENN